MILQECDIPWCEEYTNIHTPWHQMVLQTYVNLLPSSDAGAFQVVLFANGDEQPKIALVAVHRDLFFRPDHISVGLEWDFVEQIANALKYEQGIRRWNAYDARNSHLRCEIEIKTLNISKQTVIRLSNLDSLPADFSIVIPQDIAYAAGNIMMGACNKFCLTG